MTLRKKPVPHSEPTNGDRFNRQIKASEAYAALSAQFDEQNRLLFGDKSKDMVGALPEIKAAIDDLSGNPMIRAGRVLHTSRRFVIGIATFAATIAGIAVGFDHVGRAIKWWP